MTRPSIEYVEHGTKLLAWKDDEGEIRLHRTDDPEAKAETIVESGVCDRVLVVEVVTTIELETHARKAVRR